MKKKKESEWASDYGISERPLSRDRWCQWSFSQLQVWGRMDVWQYWASSHIWYHKRSAGPIQDCPPTVSEIGIIFKGYSKCWSHLQVWVLACCILSHFGHIWLCATLMDCSPVIWYQTRQRKEPLPGYLETRQGVVISDLIIFCKTLQWEVKRQHPKMQEELAETSTCKERKRDNFCNHEARRVPWG